MTPLKSAFRTVHLWLGLASGLIIVFVCLTGCILAFEKELEQAWHSERYFVVAATGTPRLSLAQLTEAVRAYKPKAKIGGLKVYADPARTVEVNLAGAPEGGKGGAEGRSGEGRMGKDGGHTGNGAAAQKGGEPKGDVGRAGGRPAGGGPGKGGEGPGKGGKGRGEGGGPRVFVNPYTAAITGELNPRDNFFKTVEMLHRGLVAGKVGKLVMGISASMFLFILATGIVLWWPVARKALSARLKVKWGQRLETPQPRLPHRAGFLRLRLLVRHRYYRRGHVVRVGRGGHQQAHPLAHQAP